MHGIDRAVRPVEEVQRVSILWWKSRLISEGYPGRRSNTDVDHRRQAVRVIRRPFARAGAPTELATTDHVANARGTVPRRADVSFVVRVIREQIAVRVHGDVVGVAQPRADQFPTFAVWIGPADPPAGRFADGPVTLARQQQVFRPDSGHAAAVITQL